MDFTHKRVYQILSSILEPLEHTLVDGDRAPVEEDKMRPVHRCPSESDTDFCATELNVIDNLLQQKNAFMKHSKTANTRCENNEKSHEDGDDCKAESINYWPDCDASIWMRSCEEEVVTPISGKITGIVPKWLRGTLLRNGPGSLKVGEYRFDHLFDSSALLHRFEISDGSVTYQRKFVQTDVYKKNHEAKRIVITEFGTKSVPDPCQSIFQRVAAMFSPIENLSDNSMISVYPFGDEYYTFAEAPIIHRVDPKTLETKNKVNLMDYIGIVNHTSHPHVMSDGTVYNMGMSITAKGPAYNIVRFSPRTVTIDDTGEENELSMFDQATIVATLPSRWILNPSYMHTFGITENYFIIVEQPLGISLVSMVACQIKNEPMCSCFKWHDDENTHIHVISRETGRPERTFLAEGFFYLHIINQFETQDRDYVVLDICCYRDAKMLDCMYVDVMKNMHKNPDYARLFRGRPLRFVLPMKHIDSNVPTEYNLVTTRSVNQNLEFFERMSTLDDSVIAGVRDDSIDEHCDKKREKGSTAESERCALSRKASAHRLPDGSIFVKPELLCDLGCETPRLNYDSYLGREYRYFYAISSDVDIDNPGTIIKVDTVKKTKKVWREKGLYPSEPIFVPDPNGKNEDEGVMLSAAIWGQERETEVALLILDAVSLREIGRASFITPGPVPKCLHGWFSFDHST